ncbi:hypothetical protein V8E36_009625 [Tilletia maclaganii]
MSARRSDHFTPLPPQPPIPGGRAGVAATPRRTPARGYGGGTPHHLGDQSFSKMQLQQQQLQPLPPPLPQSIPTVRVPRKADDLHHIHLDFESFYSRISDFTGAFNAYVADQLLLTEQDKTDARTELAERQDKIRAARRELDQQTRTQRELWNTVNDERAQDKRLRAALAMLTSQHTSLTDRLADAAVERAEAQSRLETRRQAKQSQRDELAAQRAHNAPELAALQRLLGCRIERRSSRTSSASAPAGGEHVRFSFGLLTRSTLSPARDPLSSRGMEDQDDEAWFVLDVSKPQYAVPEHFPPLPPTTLDNLLCDLNTTRALYAFIKNMREALRTEAERGAL